MNATDPARPEVILLTSGLGLVRGRLLLELKAEGGDRAWRWLLVRRGGDETLVIQLEEVPSKHPRERATAWELPAACEPLLERLREANTPERVRALLGAGTGPTWYLFEESLDDSEPPELEVEPPVRWRPAELGDLPATLVPTLVDRLYEWSCVHRVDVDEADFRPLRAAVATGGYYSHGVEVLGWDAVRLVAEVRYAGEPALVVATVTTAEWEDQAEGIRQGHFELRVVPRAGAAEAERIALAAEPGLLLRDDQANARPPVES